jgi:putative endonuclease
MTSPSDSPFNERLNRQTIGKLGERIAMQHLATNGYDILCQNWRAREGEIDLIAKDGEQIVFVEVKTRTSHAYGSPEESITPAKRRHVIKAAWEYLDAHQLLETDWRIDVVAIDLSPSGRLERLEHYQHAVGYDGDPG